MKALKESKTNETEKGVVVFYDHLSSDWIRLRSLWADHRQSERPSPHAGVGTRPLPVKTPYEPFLILPPQRSPLAHLPASYYIPCDKERAAIGLLMSPRTSAQLRFSCPVP